jgi:hypothetical protein
VKRLRHSQDLIVLKRDTVTLVNSFKSLEEGWVKRVIAFSSANTAESFLRKP